MLREYWDRTTGVARAGGYYGEGFKGGRGVTQGDPLSPTIFNVLVNVVVRHWLNIAVTEAEKRRERGREGRHQAALFYADDVMLASSDPQWLQWAFTQLVGLFDRVGLNTTRGKTVSMTCRPYSTMGNRSEEAYIRLMTGKLEQRRNQEWWREGRHQASLFYADNGCLRRPTPSGCSGRSRRSWGYLTGWE